MRRNFRMTSLQKTKITFLSHRLFTLSLKPGSLSSNQQLEVFSMLRSAASGKKLTGSFIEIVKDLMQPSAETFLKSSAAIRGHKSCCRQTHACVCYLPVLCDRGYCPFRMLLLFLHAF